MSNNKYFRFALLLVLVTAVCYISIGSESGYLAGVKETKDNEVIESYNRNLRGRVENVSDGEYTLSQGEDTLVITISDDVHINIITNTESPNPAKGVISDIEVDDILVVTQKFENNGYSTEYVIVLKTQE